METDDEVTRVVKNREMVNEEARKKHGTNATIINPYLNEKCKGCASNYKNIWCTDHDGKVECHASNHTIID